MLLSFSAQDGLTRVAEFLRLDGAEITRRLVQALVIWLLAIAKVHVKVEDPPGPTEAVAAAGAAAGAT